MALLKPLWVQPATGDAEIDFPAAEMRQLFRSLIGDGARGVIAPASAVVTQRGAGANFSVDVQPFQAIVDGTDTADQGHYLVTNTSVYNAPTPTAPGSGTRTHRLIARLRDKRSNATWTTYDWIPDLLADTGAGEPARPASSVTLAHISIAAGQANVANANIAQGYTALRDLNIRGPWSSDQASEAAWNTTATWTDFTGGQWPAVTFTVPPSGAVAISVGGMIDSPADGTSIGFGWRISGADTIAHGFSHAVYTTSGNILRTSRRRLVTGLTPGGSDTVTPGWYTSATAGTHASDEGQLLVEAVQ
jgi:hypothetical protein